MNFLLVAIALFVSNACYSQFDGLQINLEKKSFVVTKNQRVSVFCSPDGAHFYVGNKSIPKVDYSNPDSWMKRDADTLFEISKTDFDRIAELALGLSSINLLGGINTSALYIVNDPVLVELELCINGQIVSYSIFLPVDCENRHFSQFCKLCEEILLLAKVDPDVFLERKTKIFNW